MTELAQVMILRLKIQQPSPQLIFQGLEYFKQLVIYFIRYNYILLYIHIQFNYTLSNKINNNLNIII